jgi:diguanylate cyclase (GGDEF)-like protein/PAS domain S-box-containing protein
MNILGGLIQNASLLMALALAHGMFIGRLPRDRRSTQLLIGLLFGLTALLGMVYPVTLGPLIFDGRTIVISMAGLFGGIPAATVSAAIAGLYRAWLGGSGAAMGIATIVSAAALGALFYSLRQAGRVRITVWTLALLELTVHLVALGWIVLLPEALRGQVLANVALPFLVVLPLIGVLVGLLLRDQEQRIDDERARRLSEARLLEARQIAGLGDWRLDLHSGVQRWSNEVYGFLGRDPTLPPPRPKALRQVMTPESWRTLRSACFQALRDGKPWQCDVELRPAGDQRRWLSLSGQPVYDARSQLDGLRGTVQDVTEARLARESLVRERSFLTTLVATIPDLVWLKDPGGVYLACNPRFERFLGKPEAEIVGRSDRAFLPPDQVRFFRQHDLNAIAAGRPLINQETLSFADDGHQERVETIKTPMYGPDGRLIGVLGIARDMTSQLEAQQQLAAERDRIRELHARIEKIAAHVPGMIYQYQVWPDSRSAFPFASEGVKRIYGVDAAEVMEDATPAFAVLHPDDLQRIKTSIEHSAATLTTWHETYRVRLTDGRTQWVEGEATPQRQPDGSVLWHGYIHDVSERKEAETQLRLAASVFAHSLEGIAITDAQNRLVDVNPSFTRITGYSKDELIGKDPKLLASGRHDAAFYRRMWAAIHEDGFWQGEIWNRRKDGDVYPELLSISVVRDAAGTLVSHIAVFSDISQFKAHEAELNRIANYDHLTGLPNRRLLTDRLEHALAQHRRRGRALALCYLDLDGFKPVNDRYGHAVGDRLLVKVAEALRKVVRGEDTIARLGGDEFVLLLTDLDEPAACYGLLDRILAGVREPITDGDLVHSLSASIGVTLCPPDSADPDTLMRHADQAMYQAKERGKNAYHLYDAQQDRLLQLRREKLERIDLALQRDELVLHFQPQVDMISRELIGVEALVRWQHPEKGLLMPGAFLPDIEGTELEVKLDEWVIEAALRELERWISDGRRLLVSLNIGARHLLRPDFAANLQARLEAHPAVAGEDIELEILETATLSDFEQAQRVLSSCRALGVRFALDDFGTGYSSLAYFRALPVDMLKIDQSFVRDMLDDPGDKEIVESVVQLSHAFNRPVIAEGVETLAHAAMLTWLGCRFGQGYGIARPMPAADLPAWIARWSAGGEAGGELEGVPERGDLPLMLAAQHHRHWLHRFLEALRQDDPIALSSVCPDDVEFGRWYAGAGQRRYKTFAEFKPIGDKFERLRSMAAELHQRPLRGDHGLLAASTRRLEHASDELLTEIGRLIQRVAPSVGAPGESARSQAQEGERLTELGGA